MTENEETSKKDDGTTVFLVAAALFCIATPVTVLAAFATYLAFAWQRIKLSTIALFALLPSLILVAVFFQPALELFSTSWRETIPSMVNQEVEVFPTILWVFVQQIPLAIPLGILIGLCFSAYKWKNKPGWEEKEFRLSPFEWYKKRKTINDIKSDRGTPKDGMTLGIDKDGHRIVQTYAESTAHTVVLGASGSGKTTTMKSRLRDALKIGQGALIIDLKGDPKLAFEVYELAERYGHKFQHWLMQPREVPYTGPAPEGPAFYDPIARGDATRRKDLIMEMREWGEDYYRIAAASYLQVVMNVIIGNPREGVSTLSQLTELLDPKALQERAIPLGSNPQYHDVVKFIDDLNDQKMDSKEKSNLSSLRSQFAELLMSIAGQYLQTDPDKTRNNNINLKEAAHRGDVIFFSLDSSNYGGMAAVVANLLIQDLKTVSSELRGDPAPQPFQVIIDEFQAIGSGNVVGLINKSRDAKLPVTLATQALGDLRQISDAFLDQLIGIVGSFIIHRPNSDQDARLFAGLTGTVNRVRVSEAYSTGQGIIRNSATLGTGMLQEYEDYNIKPNDILNLRQGEMIYVNKYSSPMRVERVLCIPEDSDLVKGGKKTQKKPQPQAPSNVPGSDLPFAPNAPVAQQVQPELPVYAPVVQPAPVTPPPGQQTPDADNPQYVEAAEPNMDRLRQIFNQDPGQLLPEEKTTTNEYTVTVMPPIVSKPLNTPVPDPNFTPKKFPTLPPLPKPPVKQTDSNLPVPPKPSVPKPISSDEHTKDEFDF